MPQRIVHPRYRDKLINAFRSTLTIQQNQPRRSDTGAEIDVWVDLDDHVDLLCSVSVQAATGVDRDKIRRTEELDGARIASRIVLIGAYRPTITTTMRAVIDGRPWEIVMVDSDSQAHMTRIGIREVT